MADPFKDMAKNWKGAPKGIKLGLNLLIGAGALGYGLVNSVFTGKRTLKHEA